VREIDTVARVGGDEFAVIIHELNEEKEKSTSEVTIIAQKILSALSAIYSFKISSDQASTIEHHCTASIGVLVFKADEESEETLFKHADVAMYAAKEAGRNTIRFYD
jgi:diguanylate cyclase (GGDEF)-like protein